MNHAWYAVYTRHQHEKSATSLLVGKDLSVFLPLYKAVHRWKDRKQVVSLPLFPCYLFVRMRLDERLEVLRTPGVRSIVESCGRACEVPAAEVELLQRVCAAQPDGAVRPHPYMQEGERARIYQGPFAGAEGIFLRAKNRNRVVISVELLKKSISVEVDDADVEPLICVREIFTGPSRSLESAQAPERGTCA